MKVTGYKRQGACIPGLLEEESKKPERDKLASNKSYRARINSGKLAAEKRGPFLRNVAFLEKERCKGRTGGEDRAGLGWGTKEGGAPVSQKV